VFRAPGDVDVDALAPMSASELAAVVRDAHLRRHTVGFLAVMSTVDASIDAQKIAVVEAYADALDAHPEETRQLAAAAAGKLQWVIADMARQNVRSVTGRPFDGDINQWIQPYRAASDPALAARYRGLAQLPEGTLGRTFFDFYQDNGFAFAGEPDGLVEEFATHHDSTHLLSGYSTSPQGEILVSTFTAGMHPQEPVSGHILPVIFSWHIGVHITDVAGSLTGALDPEKVWVAWTRGSALTTDVFDQRWDFWSVAHRPVDELREAYEVPPLDPAQAADDTVPAWYKPTA
jgi:hypothetical protein